MSWAEVPEARLSRDGRLRLSHGPMDLIIRAEGSPEAVQAAYGRARAAFDPLLGALSRELPCLRAAGGTAPIGSVARRMCQVVAPFAPVFVTPMAAVAGAVADHIVSAMVVDGHELDTVHVNNGGDIALWTRARPLRLAICEDPVTGAGGTRVEIGPYDGIGGVATSGWRGRSHSLGIADAVTVLARTAAEADVAATLIANAVDLPGHPAITRVPANSLSPDSDLGARAVTTHVGNLSPQAAARALAPARALADDYVKRGLITGACLACQGARATIGAVTPPKELTHA